LRFLLKRGSGVLFKQSGISSKVLHLLLKMVAAVLTLVAAFEVRIPDEVRSYTYNFIQEIYKIHTLYCVRHLSTINGKHFVVKYDPINKSTAPLVLESAEQAYNQLTKKYSYPNSFPEHPIPVIIYPSRQALNVHFGWPASESAMGAYWQGVIHVLAPEVWIPKGVRMDGYFKVNGPMAHEITHLLVDNITRGNVPRWFTEGLAQYEENEMTGFKFREPVDLLTRHYDFEEMDRNFDRLSDQQVAYSQSFLAVAYLVDAYGENSVKQILGTLAAGKNFNYGLEKIAGVDLKEFTVNWEDWLVQNKKQSRNI